jgi:hypothetical protein
MGFPSLVAEGKSLNARRSAWRYHGRPTQTFLYLGVGILAVCIGAAITVQGGLLVAGTIGVIGLTIFVRRFYKDPVKVFLAVWVFQVFQAPLAASVGYNSAQGTRVRQLTDVLVVLLLILSVLRALSTKQSSSRLRFILPGVLVAVFGLASSLIYSSSVSTTLTGSWLGLKLWVLLGIALLLPWEIEDRQRIFAPRPD